MTKISIAVELDFDDGELKTLRDLFNCRNDELGEVLKPYVTAAAHEYVDMFTGLAPISTATDVRERRLVSIIRHGLREIPKAALIAKLFRMPPTAASTLLRNVSAKHEVRIGETVRSSLHAIVKGAAPAAGKKEGKRYAIINDPALVKLLNQRLSEAAESQTLIKPVEGTANKYEMDPTSQTYLLQQLKP